MRSPAVVCVASIALCAIFILFILHSSSRSRMNDKVVQSIVQSREDSEHSCYISKKRCEYDVKFSENRTVKRRFMSAPVDNIKNESHSSVPTFRYLQFNILAKRYTFPEKYPGQEKAIDFTTRSPRIISEAKRYDADILCLQEVEDDFIDELAAGLRPRYHLAAHQPIAGESKYGAAIFYDPVVFSYAGSTRVDLGKNGVAVLSTLDVNSVTIAKYSVTIVCTHLRAGATPPDREDTRVKQIHTIMTTVESFRHVNPIILSGDMNAWAYSHTWQYMSGKTVYSSAKTNSVDPAKTTFDSSDNALISYTLNYTKMQSAYNVYKKIFGYDNQIDEYSNKLSLNWTLSTLSNIDGDEPDFTCSARSDLLTLDYIWYEETSLVLLGILELPSFSDIIDSEGSLLSTFFPSDHLTLSADFEFRL